MPKLLKAAVATGGSTNGATRITKVSSEGQKWSGIRFSDYNFDTKRDEDLPVEERPRSNPPHYEGGQGDYSQFVTCGQSKTANALYSLSLTEKLAQRGLLSFAVHPGGK